MKTKLIKIGNSQGIRLPKTVLEQANITSEVELAIEPGKITLHAVEDEAATELAEMSEAVLVRDWDRAEEDEAWCDIQ